MRWRCYQRSQVCPDVVRYPQNVVRSTFWRSKAHQENGQLASPFWAHSLCRRWGQGEVTSHHLGISRSSAVRMGPLTWTTVSWVGGVSCCGQMQMSNSQVARFVVCGRYYQQQTSQRMETERVDMQHGSLQTRVPRPRYEVEILYLSWEDTHLFIFYANVIWCGCIYLFECVRPCVSMSVRVSAVHVWRSEDIFRWQPLPPSLFCDRASSCSPLWHQVKWPMSFCFLLPHHVVGMQRL